MPYRTLARALYLMGWYQLVFRLVFGRWPNQAEAEILVKNAQKQQPNNNASQFRNVLSLFDQKNYTTAFTVRLTEKDIRVVEYAGVKVAVDKAEPVIGLNIERARYEPHMVGFFQKLLRPKMTVIDVGANIGLFSLLAAKLVGEEGRVYSVEPRGENARLLLYSASLNGFENISLLATAVGNTTGYTLYQTHVGANGALMTKSNHGSDGAEYNTQAILHPTTQVVPLARLDNLIDERVDVIKLDIEGAEGMALAGATNLVRTYRPIITSEASVEMLGRVSNMTLRDYLLFTRERSYRQFVIHRNDGHLEEIEELDQFLAQWPSPVHIEDFVFVPAEKMDALAGILPQQSSQAQPH